MAYPIAATKAPAGSPATTPALSGTFIPEIWSTRLIEKFYATTVLAAVTNTYYEGEITAKGDKVKIRQRPTLTIRDYEADGPLLIERPGAAVIELLIDKGKYFQAICDDVLRRQADINLLDIWTEDAAEQMKIAVDTQVLAAFPAAPSADNKGATAGIISNNINLGVAGTPLQIIDRNPAAGSVEVMDVIVDLGTVLDEQNIPETGRWLLMSAATAGLFKKSELRDASIMGDDTSVYRNGRLGTLDRFDVYSSNLLPSGLEGADRVEYIIAGHNNAMSFASQMQEMETLRSEVTFGTLVRGLQVYGFKVIDPTACAVAYCVKGDRAA